MKPPICIAIEGERYATLHALFSTAKGRGFAGGITTFQARLKQGATTWAELLAPVDTSRTGQAQTARAAHRAEEKALMAQLCAELDARKAALREAA
jgi:ATP phosphoribosyltransferase regulatory subunit HisZ